MDYAMICKHYRDTTEGVLLKTVALGCSKLQPHPLAFHPVGVAAFNEKVS